MGHDEDTASSVANGTLDLKTVLYGLGSCVVLLAGLTWGLLSAQHTDEVERNQRTNDQQWQRLQEINESGIRRDSEIERLRKDLDADHADFEARLRALEHKR